MGCLRKAHGWTNGWTNGAVSGVASHSLVFVARIAAAELSDSAVPSCWLLLGIGTRDPRHVLTVCTMHDCMYVGGRVGWDDASHPLSCWCAEAGQGVLGGLG